MKCTLTTLTVVASLAATATAAFEINLTTTELHKLSGKPTVGDLAVGVTGLLSVFGGSGCNKEGQMYLLSNITLETNPSSYSGYYEIQKQPDGEFKIEYKPAKEGKKTIPPFFSRECSNSLESDPDATLYPVKSINGLTDQRSFIIDLVNKGFAP